MFDHATIIIFILLAVLEVAITVSLSNRLQLDVVWGNIYIAHYINTGIDLCFKKKRKKKKGKEFTSQKHLRAEGIKPAKIKIKILRTKITR